MDVKTRLKFREKAMEIMIMFICLPVYSARIHNVVRYSPVTEMHKGLYKTKQNVNNTEWKSTQLTDKIRMICHWINSGTREKVSKLDRQWDK